MKYKCKLGGNVPTGGLPCLLCGNMKMIAAVKRDNSACDYLEEIIEEK